MMQNYAFFTYVGENSINPIKINPQVNFYRQIAQMTKLLMHRFKYEVQGRSARCKKTAGSRANLNKGGSHQAGAISPAFVM
jgi:hypothetical protein